MKKLLFITAVIGMFAFASCDNTVKPGPGPGTDPIETTLTVSTIPNNVPVGGGKATFTITSNTDWTITKTDTWFSLNETNGNGDATIEVDVDANDGQQRSSTITVKTDDGQQTKTVMLTQLGKAAPNISVNNPAEVSPDGGSVTFTITANTNWTITQPTEDWLEITSALSGEGNATVTVRVENNDGSRRQSIIDVVGGPDDAIERSVTLTQKSRPRPSQRLRCRRMAVDL